MRKLLLTSLLSFMTIGIMLAQIRTTPNGVERLSGGSVISNINTNLGGNISMSANNDATIDAGDDARIIAAENVFIDASDIFLDAADDIFFDAGSTRIMSLGSSGRVSIGSAGSIFQNDGKLEIEGNSFSGFGQLSLVENEDGFARLLFQSQAGNDYRWEVAGFTGNGTDRLNIFHSDAGNIFTCYTPTSTDRRVGINTDSPTQTLSVNGSAGKPGGGSWSTFSDARLKTDVKDFEDGLEQILKIRPVRFHYNGKAEMPTDQEYIGVIAQEIQTIAPYTVSKVSLGKATDEIVKTVTEEYLSYDGTAVTYMLVNAIQEQQEMIAAKEDRIGKIEEELEQLKSLVRVFTERCPNFINV